MNGTPHRSRTMSTSVACTGTGASSTRTRSDRIVRGDMRPSRCLSTAPARASATRNFSVDDGRTDGPAGLLGADDRLRRKEREQMGEGPLDVVPVLRLERELHRVVRIADLRVRAEEELRKRGER